MQADTHVSEHHPPPRTKTHLPLPLFSNSHSSQWSTTSTSLLIAEIYNTTHHIPPIQSPPPQLLPSSPYLLPSPPYPHNPLHQSHFSATSHSKSTSRRTGTHNIYPSIPASAETRGKNGNAYERTSPSLRLPQHPLKTLEYRLRPFRPPYNSGGTHQRTYAVCLLLKRF